jgi:hypothetical protein
MLIFFHLQSLGISARSPRKMAKEDSSTDRSKTVRVPTSPT